METIKTIYDVLVGEMNIDNYRIQIFEEVKNGFRNKHMENTFPNENGEYPFRQSDNKEYINKKF